MKQLTKDKFPKYTSSSYKSIPERCNLTAAEGWSRVLGERLSMSLAVREGHGIFTSQLLITEDEMVGWHHRLDGHAFEQAPGVSAGQGSLACCSPWGRIESYTTE